MRDTPGPSSRHRPLWDCCHWRTFCRKCRAGRIPRPFSASRWAPAFFPRLTRGGKTSLFALPTVSEIRKAESYEDFSSTLVPLSLGAIPRIRGVKTPTYGLAGNTGDGRWPSRDWQLDRLPFLSFRCYRFPFGSEKRGARLDPPMRRRKSEVRTEGKTTSGRYAERAGRPDTTIRTARNWQLFLFAPKVSVSRFHRKHEVSLNLR